MRILYDTSGVGSHTYHDRPRVGDTITDIDWNWDWSRLGEDDLNRLNRQIEGVKRSVANTHDWLLASPRVQWLERVAHYVSHDIPERYNNSRDSKAGLVYWLKKNREGLLLYKIYSWTALSLFIADVIEYSKKLYHLLFDEYGVKDMLWDKKKKSIRLNNFDRMVEIDRDGNVNTLFEGIEFNTLPTRSLTDRLLLRKKPTPTPKYGPIAMNIDLDAFDVKEQNKIKKLFNDKKYKKDIPEYLAAMMDRTLELNSVVILTSNAPEAKDICKANVGGRITGKLCINANNGQYIAVPNKDGTMHVLRDKRIDDELTHGILDIFKPKEISPGVFGPSQFFASMCMGFNSKVEAHVKDKNGTVNTVEVGYTWKIKVVDKNGEVHELPVLPHDYNTLPPAKQKECLDGMAEKYNAVSWKECQSIRFVPDLDKDISQLDPQEVADIYEKISNSGMAELLLSIDDILCSGAGATLSPDFGTAFYKAGMQPNGKGGFSIVPPECSSIRGAVRIAAEMGLSLQTIAKDPADVKSVTMKFNASGNPDLNASGEVILVDSDGNEVDYDDVDVYKLLSFLGNPEAMTIPVRTKKLRGQLSGWIARNPRMSQLYWLQEMQRSQFLNQQNMLHPTLKPEDTTLKTNKKSKLTLIGRNAIAERKAGFSFWKWLFEPKGTAASKDLFHRIGTKIHLGGGVGKEQKESGQEYANKRTVETYNKTR